MKINTINTNSTSLHPTVLDISCKMYRKIYLLLFLSDGRFLTKIKEALIR